MVKLLVLAAAIFLSHPALAQITGTVPLTCVSAANAAPGISAVQADTAALTAGDYEVYASGMVSDTVAVGKGLVLEHRNAANGATLFNLSGASAEGQISVYFPRITVAASERFRWIAGTAAGAVSSLYVSSICYRRHR